MNGNTYTMRPQLLLLYYEATACMRQLMCTAVSKLRSDQLIPLHHCAHLLYPACPNFLYNRPACFHVSCMSSFLYIKKYASFQDMQAGNSTYIQSNYSGCMLSCADLMRPSRAETSRLKLHDSTSLLFAEPIIK
jgi:hypothetical protein